MRTFAAGALAAALLGTAFWITNDPDIAPELIRRGFLLALAVAAIPALIAGRHALSGVPRWAWALLLADLVLRMLSASFALDPLSAWIGGSERGLGVFDAMAWTLIALLGALLCSGADLALRNSVRLGLGAAVSLSIIGLLQVYLSWRHASSDLPLLRPTATLGNPNFLAGMLALALPVLLATAKRLWPTAIGAGLMLSALVLTQSRAGLIAAAVGSALALMLTSEHRHRRLRLMVVVLAGAVLALVWLGTQLNRPESVAIRLALYGAAIDSVRQPLPLVDIDGISDPHRALRRWIGHGPDNIEAVLTRHRLAALNRYEAQGWDRLADRTHNRWLDRWIELGALGAMLGLALGVLPLLRGLRIWRQTRASSDAQSPCWRIRMAAACACWLAYGMDGLFGVPNAALDLVGALAFGVLLAPGTVAGAVPTGLRRSGGPAWWLGFAWIFALGPAAAGWHGEALPPPDTELLPAIAQVSQHRRYSVLPSLYALEQLRAADPKLAAQGLNLDAWLDAAEHATRAGPTLPRAWHLLGWIRQRKGDAHGARQAYLRALSLLDQTQTADQHGWTDALSFIASADRTQIRDSSAAQRLLGQAREQMEALPDLARDAVWYRSYAYLLARQGFYEDAIRAYQQALVLNPGDTASRGNLQRLQQARLDDSKTGSPSDRTNSKGRDQKR